MRIRIDVLLLERHMSEKIRAAGAKRDLIAPLWSADKKRVPAKLNGVLRARGLRGRNCGLRGG